MPDWSSSDLSHVLVYAGDELHFNVKNIHWQYQMQSETYANNDDRYAWLYLCIYEWIKCSLFLFSLTFQSYALNVLVHVAVLSRCCVSIQV